MGQVKISLSKSAPEDCELLVLPVSAAQTKGSKSKSAGGWSAFAPSLRQQLKELDQEFDGYLKSGIEHFEFSPGAFNRVSINLGEPDLFLRLSGVTSLDAQDPPDAQEWRRFGGDVWKAAKEHNSKKVSVVLDSVPATNARLIVEAISEGIHLASYQFNDFKSSNSRSKTSARTFVLSSQSFNTRQMSKAAALAELRAESTAFARDLVNTPPSNLQPRDLVAAARKIASKKGSGITQRTFNRAQLSKMGANALLAVSRGSDAAPYMTHLVYKPVNRSKRCKRVVLVGKGVTYDSGGLSIKTRQGLMTMKCDMAGAACMLGVMHAISRMPKADRPTHEVHALIPTSENMINGSSVKPGDVVRALNGKTIEILNTDAEGRLLLADALSYTEKLDADIIVDAATLTGACMAALGSKLAGLFTDDDDLCDMLITAAHDAGEKLWPLPLDSEYRSAIKSSVADIKNIGSGGAPGATTAALFLKEFVPEDVRWAHLDIAGPAFVDSGNEYIQPGATGFGVGTLLQFIAQL